MKLSVVEEKLNSSRNRAYASTYILTQSPDASGGRRLHSDSGFEPTPGAPGRLDSKREHYPTARGGDRAAAGIRHRTQHVQLAPPLTRTTKTTTNSTTTPHHVG